MKHHEYDQIFLLEITSESNDESSAKQMIIGITEMN